MTRPHDPPGPLRSLRARRTARRTGGIEPFDAFYQAYVTVLLASAAILIVSSWVGDEPVATGGRTLLVADGPPLLGLLCAAALLVGLRSGSRGGPFAIDAPDIHHVLLAPIATRVALRWPAVRQLRFLAFGAVVVGAVAGQLAGRRLPGGMAGWIVATSTFALVTVVLAVAAAWAASGARLDQRVATAVGGALVGWSIWDLALGGPTAPTTVVGRVALLPLHFDAVALAALPAAPALAGLGLARLGGISLERVRRRSTLVGHLRFAATMRDLRTVMLIRRQLTQERVRRRPWLPARHREGRTVVVRRDWRALMRTPATRVARMALLGVVAAVAAAGAWAGTTPLVVVAGLAAYLAGLEAVEPLAQEIDHPSILRLAPVTRGSLLVRHLIIPGVTMLVVGLCGAAALAIGGLDHTGAGLAAVTVVTAAPAATAGAAVGTLRSQLDDPDGADATLAVPPEITGMRLVYATAWPPAIATLGFLPVLAARDAAAQGQAMMGAAASAALPVLVIVALVVAWIRCRDDIRQWTARAADRAGAARGGAGTGGSG